MLEIILCLFNFHSNGDHWHALKFHSLLVALDEPGDFMHIA